MKKLKRMTFMTAIGLGLATGPALGDEDPFIWLEEVEGERALGWVKQQNARSLEILEGDPRFEAIRSEAEDIYTATDRIPYGAILGDEVHNFWQDDDNVRGLWRKTSLESYASDAPEWETLLDLDKLAEAEGENWVYKGRDCLGPDHARCLVRLSRGGGDAVVVREFDTVSKSFVEGGFELAEGKQWTAWIDADTVLVATGNGGGTMNTSGYPRMVRIWKRGTDIADAKLVFEGAEDDAFAFPTTSVREEGTTVLIIKAPDFFSQTIFLVDETGGTVMLELPEDVDFQGVLNGHLLALLRSDWQVGEDNFTQGSLISVALDDLADGGGIRTAQGVVTPSAGRSIDGVAVTRDQVLVAMLDTVKGVLVTAKPDADGWTTREADMPENGTLEVVSTDAYSDAALVNYESFLVPDTLYLVEDGAPKPIKSLPARFDASPYATEQRFATSADGTKIPYFVVRPKDLAMDGTAPTLLYGYGGFEISISPGYASPLTKAWLEAGGVFVVANIRGGGEFGPEWHQAALKYNRQRAYDDFIAVAEDLIASKITSPRHLGIRGGSNGGLLVGATFTQRPDLFNAVICAVPLLDMLRYHMLLAGASWIGEYGDPEDAKMAEYIRTYSPYQNVKADAEYPEVFFFTSTKDDRVHPGHARKMVARMTAQGHPVLYYENIEGGHSAAANLKQRAYTDALQAVYLMRKLGDDSES